MKTFVAIARYAAGDAAVTPAIAGRNMVFPKRACQFGS